MIELRCDAKKFGELPEAGVVEVRCPSRFCGGGNGVVVIHRFDAMTGRLIETRRFRDPLSPLPGKDVDGAQHNPAAVRSA